MSSSSFLFLKINNFFFATKWLVGNLRVMIGKLAWKHRKGGKNVLPFVYSFFLCGRSGQVGQQIVLVHYWIAMARPIRTAFPFFSPSFPFHFLFLFLFTFLFTFLFLLSFFFISLFFSFFSFQNMNNLISFLGIQEYWKYYLCPRRPFRARKGEFQQSIAEKDDEGKELGSWCGPFLKWSMTCFGFLA